MSSVIESLFLIERLRQRIHWYYPTKDDLLAAVLDAGFASVTRRIDIDHATANDPRAQLIDVLERLQPFHNLHRAAYERMTESAAVEAAYVRVHDWLDSRLLAAVAARRGGPGPTGKLAIAGGVLLEGVLITGRTRNLSVVELVDMLIDALVALSDRSPA